MKECLKDFKLYNKVSTEIIEKYKNRVPNEMIDLWSSYGFGTFMQGYFKGSIIYVGVQKIFRK